MYELFKPFVGVLTMHFLYLIFVDRVQVFLLHKVILLFAFGFFVILGWVVLGFFVSSDVQ